MIKVVEYLESQGVDYRSHGKNVAVNDINIDCPFCGETAKHLGIHKSKGILHCWVCELSWQERYPKFVDLIQLIEDCSFEEAKEIQTEFSDENFEEEIISNFGKRKEVVWPDDMQEFDNPLSKSHWNMAVDYLQSRGFGTKEIIKYQLKFCPSGDFAMRIIIPIFKDRRIVSYAGRDYTDRKKENRYKNCPAKDAVEQIGGLLYNFDCFSGGILRIVEGPFDVWRMGDDNTIGLLKSKLTRGQRNLLLKKIDLIEKIIIILDRDAYGRALEIRDELSPFHDDIDVWDLGLIGLKDIGEFRP